VLLYGHCNTLPSEEIKMDLGLYDNDKGTYQDVPEIMNGIWLIHQESGDLIILAKDDAPTFDTYGNDEDLIDELHAEIKAKNLSDDSLQDDELLEPLGYQFCWDRQRRFSPETGYFYA
jgi:hypothetical protein